MVEDHRLHSLDSVGKCPACGGQMEKGFIIPPRGIKWDTKTHKYYASGESVAPSLTSLLVNLPALRCRNCGIIVFQERK